MTNTKTLMLAALAALSLSAGSAMAQDSAFWTEEGQQVQHSQPAPMTFHSSAKDAPRDASSGHANG